MGSRSPPAPTPPEEVMAAPVAAEAQTPPGGAPWVHRRKLPAVLVSRRPIHALHKSFGSTCCVPGSGGTAENKTAQGLLPRPLLIEMTRQKQASKKGILDRDEGLGRK